MSAEDHKMIAALRRRYDLPGDAARNELYETAAAEGALNPPANRIAAIECVEQALKSDDGCLEGRAQLLGLHRTLSISHAALTRAKR